MPIETNYLAHNIVLSRIIEPVSIDTMMREQMAILSDPRFIENETIGIAYLEGNVTRGMPIATMRQFGNNLMRYRLVIVVGLARPYRIISNTINRVMRVHNKVKFMESLDDAKAYAYDLAEAQSDD